MNTRLKQFMAAENITQSQLADKINVVRASVSHILSGRNNPSYDFIKALMTHYPRLNMEWLMFGRGKMYNEAVSDMEDAVSRPISADSTLFPQSEEITGELNPISVMDSDFEKKSAANTELPSSISTLYNISQSSGNQRKVVKVAIFFDDGTYQEL